MITLITQNVTAVDGWTWIHALFGFLLGFLLLHRLNKWLGVILIILFEIIENTLLKTNDILMGGAVESWPNITVDILVSVTFLWLGIWFREKLSHS